MRVRGPVREGEEKGGGGRGRGGGLIEGEEKKGGEGRGVQESSASGMVCRGGGECWMMGLRQRPAEACRPAPGAAALCMRQRRLQWVRCGAHCVCSSVPLLCGGTCRLTSTLAVPSGGCTLPNENPPHTNPAPTHIGQAPKHPRRPHPPACPPNHPPHQPPGCPSTPRRTPTHTHAHMCAHSRPPPAAGCSGRPTP